MLSAVIPVLNEENALPLVLANLRQINKLTSAFFILNSSFLKWLINHLFNDIVQLLVRGVPCKQLFYLIGMWYKKDVNCFFTF